MTIEKKIIKWLTSERIGASSKCMAAHLTDNFCDGSYPHDGGDFERCVGLLNAAPELRSLLPKMAEVNVYWAGLVAKWNEIEALPQRERHEAISSIIDPIEAKYKNVVNLGSGASIRFGGIK